MSRLARVFLVALFACGAGPPVPPYAQQRTAALALVGYPPPPARVEFVPSQPASSAVWIDGEWVWRRRRWAWRQGRWVVPPSGARFSPWTIVRGDDGAMYYASGVWRDGKDQDVPEPQALATAKPSLGEVVNPEGERENVGAIRDRHGDAGSSVSAPAPSEAPFLSPSTPASSASDSGASSERNPDGGVEP